MAYLNYTASTTQLNKDLGIILEMVMDNVSDMLLKDFLQHLDATVYSKPPAKSTYHRYKEDGGFYSGWLIDKFDKYTRTLMFDGNRLKSPQDDMVNSQITHSGNHDTGDIRDIIAHVLNDADWNKDMSINGGAYYLRNSDDGYWDTYIDNIDKKIEKWLDKEFKKYGISRR